MLKIVPVDVQLSYKIGVLNHGEQDMFREGTKDVVDGQLFRSGGKFERLEFDSGQVIPRRTPLAQCRIVTC